MKIWTTTVDGDTLMTTAHTTLDAAYESLRQNYANDVEAGNHDAIHADLEAQGLPYKIDEHDLPEVLAVSIGTPYDGMTLYGPFFDSDEALQWAYDAQEADWALPTLHDPTEGVRERS